MNQSSSNHREYLIESFKTDIDARYAYAEDFMNTVIASQIYVIRKQRGMTQAELASAVELKQYSISKLEDVNFSRWNLQALKRVAKALGVRLRVSFETFGTLLNEDENFSKNSLQRLTFEEDPAFQSARPKRSDKFQAISGANQQLLFDKYNTPSNKVIAGSTKSLRSNKETTLFLETRVVQQSQSTIDSKESTNYVSIDDRHKAA